MHKRAGAYGIQKRALDSLELQLQVSVTFPTQVLGMSHFTSPVNTLPK